MGFIKTIFKSAFGIAGVACIVAGTGVSIAPAIMIPSAKVEIGKFKSPDDKVVGDMFLGTGTKNWLQFYVDLDGTIDEKISLETARNNFLAQTGTDNKRDAAKKIIKLHEDKDPLYIALGLPVGVAERILKNDNANTWGIVLAVLGPVTAVAGFGLAYFGFKKSK
ncbi:MAG: hypothetical protein ACRC4M_05300 [Mycoplasma sp.]